MKIKLKLLLLSIMFIGLGLSFCSADGVYHDSNAGLISIVYNDSSNVITFSDKNLGATCTDTSQSCSYGHYFQWGNIYNFIPNLTNYTTNSISFTVPSGYGPGNYFSDSVFHCSYNNGGNSDLWGAVTGTPEAMQGPCPSGFHIVDNWSNIQDIFVNYFDLSSSSSVGFLSYLKMPLAGYLDVSSNSCGYSKEVGTAANYWASSSYSNYNAYRVIFSSQGLGVGYERMAFGFPVRCVKNESVSPDYTRTKIVGDTIAQPPEITVLYNNGNSSTNIVCNGDNVIQIDGLSTITATNQFTPYFNIDYRDEDNQSLIESYSKDILYLSGTLFKKTFTGDNERILTSQGNNNNSSFSGYIPTFDIVFTGDTRQDTGNVFNNFTQNSLQVLLSNIPSYIQYVIIIMLLLFILGLARRKKRR